MLKKTVFLTLLSSTIFFSATGFCTTNLSMAGPQSCQKAEAIFTTTPAAKSCGHFYTEMTTKNLTHTPPLFEFGSLKIFHKKLIGFCLGDNKELALTPTSIDCNHVCSHLVDSDGKLAGC